MSIESLWDKHEDTLRAESVRLDIDPAIAVAVLAVESAGDGFNADGTVVERFEPHHFWRRFARDHLVWRERFWDHLYFDGTDGGQPWKGHKYRKTPASSWKTLHTGSQTREHECIVRMVGLLQDTLEGNDYRAGRLALYESISYGLAQVMGFNYAACGYESVEHMMGHLLSNELYQVRSFFTFCESKRLVDALRTEDWATFVAGYNGTGQIAWYTKHLTAAVADARSQGIGA